VEVHVRRLDIHLPRLDQFVLDHLRGTPVGPMIAAVGAEVCRDIGASALEQLRRYVGGDGATYPEETHVVTGVVR
jgi:hypothetical protein